MKISRFSTNISSYIENDTRYGHSYYKMRIWNYTSFQTENFQWNWVTSNPNFYVTILFNVKLVYRRRYEIRRLPNPKLHWKNKKIRSVKLGCLFHLRNCMKSCFLCLPRIWRHLNISASKAGKLSGTHIYYRAKFHADWYHLRTW